MSRRCLPAQRDRLLHAGDAIQDCAGVRDATIVDAETDPTNAWTLEVVLEGAAVPPQILRELVLHDLALREAPTRGDPAQTVLVATPA